MKSILKKIYKKIRNNYKIDLDVALNNHFTKNLYIQRSLDNNSSLITRSNYNEEVIVSLTTFGSRIHEVYLTIESIAAQTMKPNKVILWLADDEFKISTLPLSIKNLINRGLDVRFCDDLKSYKKALFTFKNYPNSIVITIDDDMIYPIDFIERLYASHLKNPNCICCNTARRITLNKNKELMNYSTWEKLYDKALTEINLLPIGVNGVLYFPGCFDNEVFNVNNIKKLSPYADDIWFRLMSLIKGVKIHITGNYSNIEEKFVQLDTQKISPLGDINIHQGMNNKQFMAIVEFYNIEISQ